MGRLLHSHHAFGASTSTSMVIIGKNLKKLKKCRKKKKNDEKTGRKLPTKGRQQKPQ